MDTSKVTGMDTSLFLQQVGCEFINFKTRETKIVDIVKLEPDGVSKAGSTTFSSSNDMDQWLRNDATISPRANLNQTASRLRLQVCQWDPGNDVPMPFKDMTSMERSLKLLGTPAYYLHDIGRKYHVPVRITIEGIGLAQRLNVVCQTPKFDSSFATTALSYDTATGTTTGFLGHIADYSSDLAKNLKALKTCATHPILLPALIYSAYCSKLRGQLGRARTEIDQVQKDTREVLSAFLKGDESIERRGNSEAARHQTYDSLHLTLIKQHAALTNALSDFVSEMGPACVKALSDIEAAQGGILAISKTAAHADVKVFISILSTAANFELQNRARLLSRVNIQLQVLYNLMQQKISDQAMRENLIMKQIASHALEDSGVMRNLASLALKDSSAMKSIALLTMVFLPTTAIATIFSMSSFFQASPDGSSLVVSENFWIFWTVSIPVTVLVVLIWIFWTQRAEIQDRLAKRRAGKDDDETTSQHDPEKGPAGTGNTHHEHQV